MNGSRRLHAAIALSIVLIFAPRPASGQSTAPVASVRYGHHHFNITNVEEHRRFWLDGLGGVPASLPGLPTTIVRFGGVLVFLRVQPPTGTMEETSVPRVSFRVKSLDVASRSLERVGYKVQPQGAKVGKVRGPDAVVLELVESTETIGPAEHSELHLTAPDPAAMRAWYVKVLGASAGNAMQVTIEGSGLVFSQASADLQGTQGHVLDHIGFEIVGLEAFCQRLQRLGIKLDRPYFKVPNTQLAVAFLTDPWGTYIELTEGLGGAK